MRKLEKPEFGEVKPYGPGEPDDDAWHGCLRMLVYAAVILQWPFYFIFFGVSLTVGLVLLVPCCALLLWLFIEGKKWTRNDRIKVRTYNLHEFLRRGRNFLEIADDDEEYDDEEYDDDEYEDDEEEDDEEEDGFARYLLRTSYEGLYPDIEITDELFEKIMALEKSDMEYYEQEERIMTLLRSAARR
jgi:hypothetical protein